MALNRERAINILTGAIALLLFSAAVYIGVLYTNGSEFKQYRILYASFDAAGQNLQARSEVKIHGVTIGLVKNVKLVRGRAQVKLEIDHGEQVPVDSSAAIEAETLFGEKYVDIVPDPNRPVVEVAGPFFANGATITKTVPTRGTELEDVLASAYPVLAGIDPTQLATVLDTLAQATQGEGPAINDTLGNVSELTAVAADNDMNISELLSDLSLLSGSIANDSPDIVALAQSLNVVLPQVNARGDEVTSILSNLSEVSNDAANLLNANRPTQDKLILEGGQILDTVVPRLNEVDPTVVGIREFVQMLTEIGHIPYGPGTVLGAIKVVLGGGCLFGQVTPCSPSGEPTASAANSAKAATAPATGGAAARSSSKATAPAGGANGLNSVVPQVVKGVSNLLKLLGQGLGK